MSACRSAEQTARCRRDGFAFAMGRLTPDEVRNYRGCPTGVEREQG
jgi:hypothetical protein